MSSTEPHRIPLTVIGGFLGSGKTTYLNALIETGQLNNALVVINDFGDINIDAELIEYRDDRIMQLSNGCVCCTLGGTLAEQLAAALRLYREPEAVIIEASGVADPARIADIAKLSRRLTLAEVVCVIDGSQALKQAADPLIGNAWNAQVQSADTLYVNRLNTSNEEKLLDTLRKINPAASLKLDTADDIQQQPSTPQQDNERPRSAEPYRMANKQSYPHDNWRSFSLTGQAVVDKEQLVVLLEEFSDVLFRVKGFVLLNDEKNSQLLQFTRGNINFQATLREPASNRLVFIGIAGERLDAFQLAIEELSSLKCCRA